MKKLILLFLSIPVFCAWFTPKPTDQMVASEDVVAVSSDSRGVGTSGVFWRDGYFRNVRQPYRAEAPSAIASFGVVWASTDGSLYYTNAAGTTTKLDN